MGDLKHGYYVPTDSPVCHGALPQKMTFGLDYTGSASTKQSGMAYSILKQLFTPSSFSAFCPISKFLSEEISWSVFALLLLVKMVELFRCSCQEIQSPSRWAKTCDLCKPWVIHSQFQIDSRGNKSGYSNAQYRTLNTLTPFTEKFTANRMG